MKSACCLIRRKTPLEIAVSATFKVLLDSILITSRARVRNLWDLVTCFHRDPPEARPSRPIGVTLILRSGRTDMGSEFWASELRREAQSTRRPCDECLAIEPVSLALPRSRMGATCMIIDIRDPDNDPGKPSYHDCGRNQPVSRAMSVKPSAGVWRG